MENYEGFKRRVFSMTKIDLDSYKEKQMRRRIDCLLQEIIVTVMMSMWIY